MSQIILFPQIKPQDVQEEILDESQYLLLAVGRREAEAYLTVFFSLHVVAESVVFMFTFLYIYVQQSSDDMKNIFIDAVFAFIFLFIDEFDGDRDH